MTSDTVHVASGDQTERSFYMPNVDDIFTSYFTKPVAIRDDNDKNDLICAQLVDKMLGDSLSGRLSTLHGWRGFSWVSLCYPDCEDEEKMLQIGTYCTALFHFDDLCNTLAEEELNVFRAFYMVAHEHMGDKSAAAPPKQLSSDQLGFIKLTSNLWTYLNRTADIVILQRFKESMVEMLQGMSEQAHDRDISRVPDLETLICGRRAQSGTHIFLVFLQYLLGIKLSDFVWRHPVLTRLYETMVDLLVWSNDLWSYNLEQARGDDNSNMIRTLMVHHELSLQGAVDEITRKCREKAIILREQLATMPSFGDTQTDTEVANYTKGLENIVIGVTHVSYIMRRYFGADGLPWRNGGIVTLLPAKSLSVY